MAVDQVWTDPSSGGAIDLATDDVLNETIWDKVLSNLKHIMGTAGFTGTPSATRGIEPASGYFMGAAAQNRHVEYATSSGEAVGMGATNDDAITFVNAFGSNPTVTTGLEHSGTAAADARVIIKPSTLGTTGVTLQKYNNVGGGLTMISHMIAVGAD